MKTTTIYLQKTDGCADILSLFNQLQMLLNTAKNGLYEITVKEYRRQRTTDQNRYLWLCLNIIADETGHTPLELHDIFCNMFLATGTTTFKGKQYIVTRGTSQLDTAEFTAFIERIKAEVATMGITLPDTDSPLIDNYYKKYGN